MINLRDRLIVDYSSLNSVSKILSNSQNEVLLVFFTIAILFEFFGEWNFFKVVKRIVVCFIVLVIFDPLLKGAINLSFEISNSLIDKCKYTEFCTHYLTVAKSNKMNVTLWSETVYLIKNFSSFWIHSLVSLIFKIAFIFTIQIYSLVYALITMTYPLICSLGILPMPGDRAFEGIFQTILWLFVSPIILSVIIVLLASVTDVGIGPKGEVGLEGLLHLMVISLFSLGSLFLSWILCKGEGVASFGAKVAQMGTTVLAMAGVGGISSMNKGFGGMGRDLGLMGSSAGSSKLKNMVSSKVSSGIHSKGLDVSAGELAASKNSPLNSPIIPKGSAAYNSLSGKEKILHSVDSFINAKENSLAKQNMVRDFKKISASSSASHKSPHTYSPTDSQLKASDYKNDVRKRYSRKSFSQSPVPGSSRSKSFEGSASSNAKFKMGSNLNLRNSFKRPSKEQSNFTSSRQ
jgi:hypothetical protein